MAICFGLPGSLCCWHLLPAAENRQLIRYQPTPGLPPAADRWIAADQGCKVSNADRKPDETIEWSGLCRSGFAEGIGVVRWLEGGREIGRDDGDFHGGKMNGKGSRGFDNGDYYAGSFTDRVPSGTGTLRYSRGIRAVTLGNFATEFQMASAPYILVTVVPILANFSMGNQSNTQRSLQPRQNPHDCR